MCSHIHEIEENLSTDEKRLLENIILPGAIAYCVGQTGLSKEELDEHEDITIAVLCVIAEMWDNRSITINQDKLNPVVDAILSMYPTNLLPSAE